MITELFPWSAEARMLQFLMHQKLKHDEYYFRREIADYAGIHPRTVVTKIERLVEIGLLESQKMYDAQNRPKKAYRFAESEKATSLMQLEMVLVE